MANDTEEGDTLETLLLKADQIGNKYQTVEERNTFEKEWAKVVEEVSIIIDQQFPESEMEYIDFSQEI